MIKRAAMAESGPERMYLNKYRELLESLDVWFRSIQTLYPDQILCKPGCAQCCHGLFDVSLPDVLQVADAFSRLPAPMKIAVKDNASAIQMKILREHKELEFPYLLNANTPEKIDRIICSVQDVRCPFLDTRDTCLIYSHRPLACRLEGIPMVDVQDELFGDWCDLNFSKGISPKVSQDLNLDYYKLQTIELNASASIAQHFLAERREEVAVFVPSIVAGFEGYWSNVLSAWSGA